MKAALFLGLAVSASTAPAAAQPIERAEVGVDKIIAAMEVCRKAPPGRDATFTLAKAEGFAELPQEQRTRFPMLEFVPLERGGIWLRAKDPNFADGSGGSCEIMGKLAANTDPAAITELLATKFDAPGQLWTKDDPQSRFWTIDGRYINARMYSGNLTIFVGLPKPSEAQVAAAKEANKQREATMLAQMKAEAVPSSSIAIADAAAGCLAAVANTNTDKDALLNADGWVGEASKPGLLRHTGNAVRIFVIPQMCVVDAYGEHENAFGNIKDAIRAALEARFGKQDVKLSTSVGSKASFSQGQGFVVRGTLGALSSEKRPYGLSIRFTVASLDRKLEPK